jgi:amino acid adenylation domain-containing protein
MTIDIGNQSNADSPRQLLPNMKGPYYLPTLGPSVHGGKEISLFQFSWALVAPKYLDIERVELVYLDDSQDHKAIVMNFNNDEDITKHEALNSVCTKPYEEESNSLPSSRHSELYPRNFLQFITGEGIDQTILNKNCDVAVKISLHPTAQASYNFNTARFTDTQITRLHQQFAFVLQQLSLLDDAHPISVLQTLNPCDRKQIDDWNRTEVQRLDETFSDVLKQQAFVRPDAIAVDGWDGRVSYKELDKLSSSLAHYLYKLWPDSNLANPIPICFENSTLVIILMIAIQKMGGCYVVMDPGHPPERIQAVLSMVEAKAVIASSVQSLWLREIIQSVITLEPGFVLKLSDILFERHTPSSSPAYIQFTSGSTGDPKGIVIDHSSLCSTCAAHAYWGLDPDSRVLQSAPLVFSASVCQIYVTMYFGGCVCVPRTAEVRSSLADCVTTWRINSILTTPTGASLLDPKQVPGVHTIVVGGEPVPKSLISRWVSQARMYVGYGQSEATFTFTGRRILEDGKDALDVGTPRNAKVWIVHPGDHNRLQPLGCVGELLVESGGISSSSRFFKDPARSKSTFVSLPEFLRATPDGQINDLDQLQPPSRTFLKTGDLARFSDDGSIIYVERKDHQAKWNGIRIDLAEVAHCLMQSSKHNIWAVACEMIKPTCLPGRQLLAAFVCADITEPTDLEDLILPMTLSFLNPIRAAKSKIQEKVPYYMVPQIYIPLRKIPTNISGKVDRKALRALGAALSPASIASYGLGEQSLSPQHLTEEERVLQTAWAEILQMPVNIIGSGNFLQLGGDSVAAIRLTALLRTQGHCLSVADCLVHPDLKSMAAAMRPEKKGEQRPIWQDPFPYALLELSSEVEISGTKSHISAVYNIAVDAIQDIYPCSPMQESLMAMGIKNPGTYIAQTVLSIPKQIDLERYQNSWERVYKTTPILRSRITDLPNHGCLVVVVDDTITWKKSGSFDNCQEDRKVPMSFGDCLTRFCIIDTGDKKDLVFTWHHAILDGWSLHLLLEKVRRAYDNESIHSTPGLCRFSQYLQALDYEASRSYWASQGSAHSISHFPQPRHEAGAFSVDPQTNSASEMTLPMDFQANGDYTLATVLQAAWALVVAAHTNKREAIFGLIGTGRHAPIAQVDEIIGPTISCVPFWVQVDKPDMPVAQFLTRIQAKNVSILKHEYFGLQHIAKISLEHANMCKFQNILVIQPDSMTSHLAVGGIHIEKQTICYDYPLVMECQLGKESIKLTAQFDSKVIEPRYVNVLLHHMKQAVKELTSSPTTPIGKIDVFSDFDLSTISSWQKVSVPPLYEDCVHNRVKLRTEERPLAVAISAWDGTLSYEELDILSSTFAKRLLATGIGSNQRKCVPLCFEKSRWAIVAMLGIMKCGASYSILDPLHPTKRLQSIVQSLHSRIVVTSRLHASYVSNLAEEIICFDEYELLQEQVPDREVLLPTVSPTAPVVIQFTSGSTGVPKGIVVEHATLCSSSMAHGEFYGIGPETRMYNFAAFVFDVSVADIWTTLIHGGCVCVPKDEDRYNDLAGSINALEANMSFLTPSVANLLDPREAVSLKKLILGGEKLTHEVVEKWADVLHLVACYGPAETCIYSSATPALNKTSNPANIGKPFGCRYWIVNPENPDRLSPVGTAGELWIEGPIVTKGYLEDPARTAASFVTNPPWCEVKDWPTLHTSRCKPRRFYRTGDICRYSMDGSVLFEARKDAQVKVNGQRVELDEVEYIMSTATDIKNAVVVFPRTGRLKERLVAVLVFKTRLDNPGSPPVSLRVIFASSNNGLKEKFTGLRKHLSARLAPYMIPSIFIAVEALPYNTSGKIDRTSVNSFVKEYDTDIQTHLEMQTSPHRCPKDSRLTALEEKIQRLCSEVLQVPIDQISITAIRLVMLARRSLLDIKAKDILTSNSLFSLCHHTSTLIEPHTSLPHDQNSVSTAIKRWQDRYSPGELQIVQRSILPNFGITEDHIEDVYSCSPIQEGMLITRSATAQPFYAAYSVFEISSITDRDPLDINRLADAWRLVAQYHPILRTIFFESPSSTRLFDQAVLKTVPDNIVQLAGSDSEAKALLECDAKGCAQNITSNQAIICQTAARRTFLKLNLLHTCYDGHSIQILVRDLGRAYSGELQGTSNCPYSQFVAYLQETPIEKDMQFWGEYLRGVQPCNFLIEPNLKEKCSQTLRTVSVPISEVNEMFEFVRTRGLTVASIMKAAWSLVLRNYHDNNDVCFGFVTSGRDAPIDHIEDGVGPYIRQLICRTLLNDDETISGILYKIQSQTFDCISHQNPSLLQIQQSLGTISNRLFNTNISVVHLKSDKLISSDLAFNYIALADPAEVR